LSASLPFVSTRVCNLRGIFPHRRPTAYSQWNEGEEDEQRNGQTSAILGAGSDRPGTTAAGVRETALNPSIVKPRLFKRAGKAPAVGGGPLPGPTLGQRAERLPSPHAVHSGMQSKRPFSVRLSDQATRARELTSARSGLRPKTTRKDRLNNLFSLVSNAVLGPARVARL